MGSVENVVNVIVICNAFGGHIVKLKFSLLRVQLIMDIIRYGYLNNLNYK